jgi:hypothetical protein
MFVTLTRRKSLITILRVILREQQKEPQMSSPCILVDLNLAISRPEKSLSSNTPRRNTSEIFEYEGIGDHRLQRV